MEAFTDACNSAAQRLESDSSILYELSRELRQTMIQYNQRGLLTFVSQPGAVRSDVMYQNENQRLQPHRQENVICSVSRQQRAYVRGYMTSAMAEALYRKLKDDNWIFIRTTTHNRPVPFEVLFGSVIFHKGEPVLKVESDEVTIDAHWSFNLRLPLRRPFSEVLGDTYPRVNASDIVEVEVIESRWNDNSYLWSTLLAAL